MNTNMDPYGVHLIHDDPLAGRSSARPGPQCAGPGVEVRQHVTNGAADHLRMRVHRKRLDPSP